MSQQIDKSQALGLEVKHVTYVKDRYKRDHDMLVAKCIVHMKDGSRIPILQTHEDYMRPFWVTQPGRQVHRDKKDYELAKNCTKYTCKQIELTRKAASILGDYSAGPNPPQRRVSRSPFLYGSDISSTALLRNEYKERWPDLRSLNTVAGGDIETNVHSSEGEIICMSVTHREKAKLFYLRSWISEIEDLEARTHEMAERYIGETMRARNVTLEIGVYETPGQLVVAAAELLHEWKPDFFTFWNMDFDVTRMIAALEKEGIDPAEVFSDPSIPKQYRYFDYRPGQTQKVTASGKSMSINIEDRWNWVTHPATFQFIDSLPVYRILRVAAGKDSSYKLDYILDKEFGGKLSKLRIKETEHLSGLRWHEVMQSKYKLEYAIYNVFDSMTLELLDEKTKDLAASISSFSKSSDYKNFNSNPKRLCDDMHFWYLRRDEPCVIGSASDQPVNELDDDVIGHDDWIVTLPSYMAGPLGVPCVKEFPSYNTLIFSHVADLDIVSTYPNVSQLLNIARETCVMEFSRMQGISEHHRREVGVNLTGGKVNAVEICQKMLAAPNLDALLDGFNRHIGNDVQTGPLEQVGTPPKYSRAPAADATDDEILSEES